MKKTLIFAVTILSMVACKKNGHMYKAIHAQHVSPEHYQGLDTTYATDFFYRDYRDDKEAWAWYQNTDAYKTEAPKSDSTWVEYWGTYEEWKSIGK